LIDMGLDISFGQDSIRVFRWAREEANGLHHNFLLIYDRDTGTLLRQEQFETDVEALDARGLKESVSTRARCRDHAVSARAAVAAP
jgi:hypothetical protein